MSIKIGVLGAIGVDDIGDIVLLQQAISDLSEVTTNRSNIELVIFSFNVEKTIEQLVYDGNQLKIKVVPMWPLELFNDNLTRHSSRTGVIKDLEIGKIQQFTEMEYLYSCDALYFIGGGYFNEYWGEKLWSYFITPLIIFQQLKKRVYISAITLGPFSNQTLEELKGSLTNCHTITLRDHSVSLKNLKKIEYTTGDVLLNTDDILKVWSDSEQTGYNLGLATKKKYMVTHLFHWAEKYADDIDLFYQKIAKFLDYMIDYDYIDEVVFLPFNHFRDNKKGGDYMQGETLMAYIKNKKKFTLMEPVHDYMKMRNIIEQATFVLANRYHPVVFSLGAKTPVLGIYVNDLYKQKLQGTYEVLNINPDDHTFYINTFTVEDLINWFNINITLKGFPLEYDQLMINYRKQKLRSISSFIQDVEENAF